MDDIRLHLLALNLKNGNQAEELKHNLKDLKEWVSEANFFAAVYDDPMNKNTALRASTKLICDLCDDFAEAIDDIRKFVLEISEAAWMADISLKDRLGASENEDDEDEENDEE